MGKQRRIGWLQTARGVTIFGMVINLGLSIGKIAAGFVFSSQAILADGLHSLSDLISDFAVLVGLKLAAKPADDDHHYGHYRVTTLVAMFIGAILIGVALWIIYSSIVTIHQRHSDVQALIPLIFALASIPSKEYLYQITKAVGRRSGDMSLIANAWHHRTDAFTSVAAAIGLGAVYWGGPEWAFMDHVTAIVLSTFLVVVAVKIIRESAAELIDRAPDPEELSRITTSIASTEGVVSFHAVRARKKGGKVAMDLHIQVEPSLTVRQGHDIATRVKQAILDADHDVIDVIVHLEPSD